MFPKGLPGEGFIQSMYPIYIAIGIGVLYTIRWSNLLSKLIIFYVCEWESESFINHDSCPWESFLFTSLFSLQTEVQWFHFQTYTTQSSDYSS